MARCRKKRKKLIKIIKKELKKHKLKKEFIDQIIKIVKEHSFGKKQTSIESKVLFDADKLEYVNPQRLSWFIQATKDKCIKKKLSQQYCRQWYERITKISSLLHFEFSKDRFKKNYKEATRIMDSYFQKKDLLFVIFAPRR